MFFVRCKLIFVRRVRMPKRKYKRSVCNAVLAATRTINYRQTEILTIMVNKRTFRNDENEQRFVVIKRAARGLIIMIRERRWRQNKKTDITIRGPVSETRPGGFRLHLRRTAPARENEIRFPKQKRKRAPVCEKRKFSGEVLLNSFVRHARERVCLESKLKLA